MSERTLQILALAFLALAVFGGWKIGPYNELPDRKPGDKLPMELGRLGNRPVIEIELARNESDLIAVLKSGEHWEKNLENAKRGNELDTFLFIPGYAGLLLFLGLLVGCQVPQWRSALSVIALVGAPLIAILDWLENAGITATLNHFGAVPHMPQVGDAVRISDPSFVKWTLIASILLFYFLALFANARKISWAYRLIALAALSLSGITFYTLGLYVIARVG
jgi:hypothetical protein